MSFMHCVENVRSELKLHPRARGEAGGKQLLLNKHPVRAFGSTLTN